MIGEYKGSNKKTLFECNLGHRFYSYPSYIVKSILNGCNECRKINNGYCPKKTNEQYLKELKNISSVLIPLEEYKNANTHILHRCSIHNIDFKTTPSNALKGTGCKECGKEKVIKKSRKTKQEYLIQLKESNPNIMLIGEYLGADTKTTFKCKQCGNIWDGRPQSYILPKAFGCRKCADIELYKTRNMGIDEYKRRLSALQNNIIVLDDNYINSQTQLLHKCLICKNEWNTYPNSILCGHGCPKCEDKATSIRMRKTHDEFMQDFNKNNPSYDFIIILSKYEGCNSKIKCKCVVCENCWETIATNLLCGEGCPICKSSFGERKIARFFIDKNIPYIAQHSFDGLIGLGNRNLLYDFYLRQYNLLIEFQGQQHEHPIEMFGGEEQFKKQQEHDKRKREYAKENNIHLLEIWYYDIDNIENILNETLNNLKLESLTTAG